MRVLVRDSEDNFSAFKATNIEYNDEIDGLSIENADYIFYIPCITKIKCNDIMRELVRYGYADLTAYQIMQELD